MEQYKCGYCKWILKHDQLEQHSCFANNLHSLVMDNERRIFITGNETNETNEDNVQDEYWLDENFSETNEDNVQDKDRLDENFSETNEDNVQDKDRLDEDLNETNEDNVQDKDRLDEELISAVKNRPALYDSSLPVKQRGRKQKDRLWNEVSVLLKGLYTPSEAEKRWNYLRDCYRKAKNAFKKRQAMLQRSGAAGIPKSETIMPSFRHYNEMTFLNDTLEHRQTVTFLKAAINNEQTSTSRANIDNVQSNISNNDTLECGLLESLNMAKICLFTKVIEWKRSLILNCHKEIERKKLIKATLIYKYLKRRQRKADLHRFWVRPIFSVQKRYQQEDSDNLIKEMINTDPDKYFEYFRMNIDVFNELLELIEPSITKLDVVRSPISATTRLQICLRYLASGDSMHSISFAFCVGLNTVSKIVSETCQAIWDNLKDIVFPENSENSWLQRAKEFEELLDFPNCIGAIDGKHVVLQAPPHSGSTYYNYKNSHSIVLLAVADANCCFTIVDIGAEGRRSDGGIFRDSKLGHQLENNDLKLPKARSISENGPTLPYVLVGDAAFGLTSYMLRPYPQSCNLNIIKSIFNYRLSHTWKVVECTFGIWTGRWRIFRRPLMTNVDNAILIVQSTVCLHNFLMMKDLNFPIENRSYSVNIPLQDQNSCQGLHSLKSLKNNTFRGSTVRDQFAQYFTTSGAINQQWTKAYTRDY